MKTSDRETFREEANELLLSVEEFLLDLERLPDDVELLGGVFRELRASGDAAQHDLPALVRKVEAAYDKVRNGEIQVVRRLTDLTVQARDALRSIMDGRSIDNGPLRKAIVALDETISGEASPGERLTGREPADPDEESMYSVALGPSARLFLSGPLLIELIEEARGRGECSLAACFGDLQRLASVKRGGRQVSWNIILSEAGRGGEKENRIAFRRGGREIKVDTCLDAQTGLKEALLSGHPGGKRRSLNDSGQAKKRQKSALRLLDNARRP